MNLTTTYMGLELANPLMSGASPLADDLDTARRLEDAGASAIVMRSLFEEQIEGEHAPASSISKCTPTPSPRHPPSFPAAGDFALSPDAYLEQIRRLKEAVDVPVIASLNGLSISGWLRYAELIEQAGADALELNVYHVATESPRNARIPSSIGSAKSPERPRGGATSAGGEAFSVFHVACRMWRWSCAPPASTGWSCSTASISPTSIWRK